MRPRIPTSKQKQKRKTIFLPSNRKIRFRAIKGEQSMMGNYASGDSIYGIQ